MERPYVICHMLMALDGKIDGPFFTADETVPALHKYGEVRKFYDCPATVYGTTTMAEGYADGYVSDLPETELTFPREDYLGGCDVKNYIVSLDGEGVLAWCPTAILPICAVLGSRISLQARKPSTARRCCGN